MEITPSNLAALRTRYNQVYQQAFLKQDVIWPKMAQLITSLAESETHVWLDRIPQLRKWSGDRVVQNASLRTYQLTNVPYELTMGLDRYKVEDNKINAFQPVVQQMAMQAKKWPDTLFFDSVNGVLAQGINVNTYDGVPYFNTAHPINPDLPAMGTQSNYSASGMALNLANFGAVRQAMKGWKGADGLPLKINPKLLMVPPALEPAGIQVLQAEWLAPTGVTYAAAANAPSKNPFYGAADLLVVDDLAGVDTTWYLADPTSSIKPWIFQLRQPAEFVMKTRPDDPAIFSRHEIQYGVSVRGAGGYGPWFTAYRASA